MSTVRTLRAGKTYSGKKRAFCGVIDVIPSICVRSQQYYSKTDQNRYTISTSDSQAAARTLAMSSDKAINTNGSARLMISSSVKKLANRLSSSRERNRDVGQTQLRQLAVTKFSNSKAGPAAGGVNQAPFSPHD
jgi:hypothetical protein